MINRFWRYLGIAVALIVSMAIGAAIAWWRDRDGGEPHPGGLDRPTQTPAQIRRETRHNVSEVTERARARVKAAQDNAAAIVRGTDGQKLDLVDRWPEFVGLSRARRGGK